MQLQLAPEVEAARDKGTPIVALESTLVAHGLPWPDNHAVARELEDTVRAGGAVPATIAIVDGKACIGLSAEQLEKLARDGSKLAKAGA
ncbi:MAG: pseudouridine-5'-phosphate glycosidase, partial [Deltaproteobacteria bacterium]|nr:pseudouridine-5'-phosphate glycosidase [Deltaproteobacteria bacterium]